MIISPYESMIKDVRNFARYITIVDPKRGRINFEPRNYQLGLLKRYQNNSYTIVKHTRQCGATITSAIYLLWHALTKPNQNIVVSGSKLQQSFYVIEEVKRMYEYLTFKNLPGWSVKEWNKHKVEFTNGSTITAVASVATRFQGMNVDVLFIDNAAFIKEDVLKTMNPTIKNGGKIIMTSCPGFTEDNFFERLFDKAVAGTSNFKPFNIKGFQVPGRDKSWMEEIKKSYGVETFKREFNWY